MRNPVKTLHLVIGIGGIILFTLTGQFMHHHYEHLRGMPDMPRALMRAGHIYILLSSIIHLMLGVYLKHYSDKIPQTLSRLVSVLLIAAYGLIVYSFFTELPPTQLERPMARFGLYATLAGAIAHGLSCFTQGKSD